MSAFTSRRREVVRADREAAPLLREAAPLLPPAAGRGLPLLALCVSPQAPRSELLRPPRPGQSWCGPASLHIDGFYGRERRRAPHLRAVNCVNELVRCVSRERERRE